jgi:hypothetical protein
MNKHYSTVAERAGHRCEYCRAPEVIFNLPFEVEHIVPASLEVHEVDSNLALACRACNLFKSNHQMAVDDASGQTVRLFDPRHDRWDEHFEVDRAGAAIVGLTPIGRATVVCLRMNRDVQREARRSWMSLGLYP